MNYLNGFNKIPLKIQTKNFNKNLNQGILMSKKYLIINKFNHLFKENKYLLKKIKIIISILMIKKI